MHVNPKSNTNLTGTGYGIMLALFSSNKTRVADKIINGTGTYLYEITYKYRYNFNTIKKWIY